jgi:hypothetical protein
MRELEEFTAQAIKKMDSLKKETIEKVASGSCSNFEHYKTLTSRIAAIGDCQKLLSELLRDSDYDEND